MRRVADGTVRFYPTRGDTIDLCRRLTLVCVCTFAICVTSLIAVSSAFSKEEDHVNNCDDSYFGISGPLNFSKALKCYRDRAQQPGSGGDKNYQRAMEILILMHLNGEGMQTSVQKAEQLFEEWQQDELEAGRDWLLDHPLKQVIEERKQHPKKVYPRLEYCQDIAYAAYDNWALMFCTEIGHRKAENTFKRAIAMIRAKLPAPDAALLDRVVSAFAAYKDAERQRAEFGFRGRFRHRAGTLQESFLREEFLELVRETIEGRRLQPADESAYKAADDELNRVIRENIQTEKEDYKTYEQLAKQSQLHWITYRDLWVELARSLYKDKRREFDPVLSMKTAVTRIRIRQLSIDWGLYM